jgi:hypothetical protein
MFYPVVVTLNGYATLWRYRMDFIEKIFGFSPDGGSGAFEVLVFVIPIVGLYLLCQRRSSSPGDSARSTGPN